MGIAAALNGEGATWFLVTAAAILMLGASFYALRTRLKRHWSIALTISASALIFISVTWFAFFVFEIFKGSEAKDLGAAGDLFGGVLNPLIAAAALFALLQTIHIQREELRLTRDELAKSSKALEGQKELYERQLFNQMLTETLADLDASRRDFCQIGRGGKTLLQGMGAFSEFSNAVHREVQLFYSYPTVSIENPREKIRRYTEKHCRLGFDPNRFIRSIAQACAQADLSPVGAPDAYQRIALRMSNDELTSLYFFAFLKSAEPHVEKILKLQIPEILDRNFSLPSQFGDPTDLLRLAHSLPASNPSASASNS